MKTPNLFDFATSELSQDAFICWLLSWAAPEHAAADLALHSCSRELIAKFFAIHETPLPHSIDSIEVTKQSHHIDVLCMVNGKYAIIIEDKTGTQESNNQLARYIEAIRSKGIAPDDILPIYFKTHDQSSYITVVSSGYRVVSRHDLLLILESCSSTNAILVDFRNLLNELESKYQSYLTLPLSEWYWHSWIGFYQALQQELKLQNECWRYVANPAGGFLSFYWAWHHDDGEDCGVYLQLEQQTLCFKVGDVAEEKHQSARGKWHELIVSNARQCGLQVTKPGRFGKGAYMTVAVLNDEYRITKPDGLLDMAATFQKVHDIEAFFRRTVSISSGKA